MLRVLALALVLASALTGRMASAQATTPPSFDPDPASRGAMADSAETVPAATDANGAAAAPAAPTPGAIAATTTFFDTTGTPTAAASDAALLTAPTVTVTDPLPYKPDWAGARRDALYFMGYQLAAMAVLYVMPQSVSGWSEEQKKNYSFEKWRYNVTHPVWDSDVWYINWVLHPYWGATYYIRGRERGLDRMDSFWFSALLSTLWEYGAEALAERVSIQDLIFTPLLGAVLGEYVFTPWRQGILAKQEELGWWDKTVLVVTDPLGAMNQTVDSWFGVKSSVQFQPIGQRSNVLRHDPLASIALGPVARQPAAWGLQLQIAW